MLQEPALQRRQHIRDTAEGPEGRRFGEESDGGPEGLGGEEGIDSGEERVRAGIDSRSRRLSHTGDPRAAHAGKGWLRRKKGERKVGG